MRSIAPLLGIILAGCSAAPGRESAAALPGAAPPPASPSEVADPECRTYENAGAVAPDGWVACGGQVCARGSSTEFLSSEGLVLSVSTEDVELTDGTCFVRLGSPASLTQAALLPAPPPPPTNLHHQATMPNGGDSLGAGPSSSPPSPDSGLDDEPGDTFACVGFLRISCERRLIVGVCVGTYSQCR